MHMHVSLCWVSVCLCAHVWVRTCIACVCTCVVGEEAGSGSFAGCSRSTGVLVGSTHSRCWTRSSRARGVTVLQPRRRRRSRAIREAWLSIPPCNKDGPMNVCVCISIIGFERTSETTTRSSLDYTNVLEEKTLLRGSVVGTPPHPCIHFLSVTTESFGL